MVFLNIFSNKKGKPKEKKNEILILIDNRERNSLVPSELSSLGFKIEFQQLPVADYLINNIAIERKSISDFKSSIINKRLPLQLLELKQYSSYLLIIEGSKKELFNSLGMHRNAVRGFILSALLDLRIPIIFTKSEKETAQYLSVLAKKQEKSSPSIRASKITFSKE